jgi:hypothetical protein
MLTGNAYPEIRCLRRNVLHRTLATSLIDILKNVELHPLHFLVLATRLS